MRNESIILPPSNCPHCKHTLAWYDNIPIISWILLRGRCRYCNSTISWLYPFIEIITPLTIAPLLLFFPLKFFPAYFIFFSALIVTIRSDLETMLISRFVTLFLLPVPFLFSILRLIPLTLPMSIVGAFFGYFFLYFFGLIFRSITKKDGIGQGDLELLAMIGAFTGIVGAWFSLMIGSILGSCAGLLYITLFHKERSVKIPFGPFLAIGAILYVYFQHTIALFLFNFE